MVWTPWQRRKADLDSGTATLYYTPTMKNIIGYSLGVGTVLGALLTPVRSEELPARPEPVATSAETGSAPSEAPAPSDEAHSPLNTHHSPGTARTTGKVLVLDNENTLTGDIERIDDKYRIKRLIGETWVPASRALRLCASLEEAYAFLQSRANLNDPDERLRLADWCRQHGLTAQALTEAEAAVALRPRDARAKRLAAFLLEMKTRPLATAAPAPEKKLPPIDVTAESLSVFAARVQPILMNACANCHTAGRGGSFQLIRTYQGGLGDRRSLEQNLAVVLSHVNTSQPIVSRLLTKSVSLHGLGMTTAPLRGRQAPAYLTLERWVMDTLANNPQLRANVANEPPATATTAAIASMPPSPARQNGQFGDERAANSAPAVTGTAPVAMPTSTEPAGARPVSGPSSDPVDPDDFNKHFHPERKGGSSN
jgi:hypothetical protein